MGTDNRAEFILSFEGDAGGISTIMNAFKRSLKGDVAEIEQITANVQLFKGLKGDLETASAAVAATNTQLEKLKDLASNADVPIGKEMIKSLRDAEKAANAATREFEKQTAAVDKMAKTLTAAGVNTKSLATEETRLALALRQAQDAETQRQAKQQLGLKTLSDVRVEVQKLYAAYNTLSASGTLSVKEVAAAQQQLQSKVAELRAGITGVGAAAKAGGGDLIAFFRNSLLPALGITATLAGLTSALKDAVEQAKQFNQGVAEIGTVTNLSKEQLAALGAGARRLATDIGIDVNAALKGLFDLIRSGVPAENAIDVLRVSAEAAKAALTDVATGVKAANVLIDNFGASTADLPVLFDKIARGAHEGGATLKEFADSGGPLLSVARSLGFSFDDVLATLTVLVDKSGNAEKSFADLTKILAKIDTAEARDKLRELGITGDSLVEIFTQIGERGLSLEQVLGLNLSAGGAKSAASLAALTKNAGELPAKLDAIRSAAGETARNLATLFDTPKERADRFNAAVSESSIQLGLFLGSSSKLAAVATSALGPLNELSAGFRANSVEGTIADNAVSRWIAGLFGVVPATAEAKQGLADMAEQQRLTAQETARTDAAIQKQITNLGEFATKLAATVQALQAASGRDIADVNARANAQIAALDRTKAAEAATTAATVAIRLKLAQDTLAILEKSEKDIAEVTNAAIAAREKATRDSFAKQNADATKQAEFEKKLAAESADARLKSIGPTLQAYKDLYASLIALAQDAATRVQGFEEARVSIVQKVEDAIRGIRFEALGGLDAYVARMAEIDRLVSEARKKAAEGDTAEAKKFFDQAITASNGLTRIVKEDGTVLITTTQAQTDKVAALQKIQKAANETFGEQGEAAKKGANAFKEQADIIAGKITELQGQYDTLKATVADGLKLKIETDQASINKAFAELDALTKPRTVIVTVKTVNEGGTPVDINQAGGGPPSPFSRGGPVRAQRFARGGTVFRKPPWLKVPGSGSGDTVPAALQAGSFVVRKAASSFYGDGLMSRLAAGFGVRRFAGGGTVTKEQLGAWAQSVFGYNPFANVPQGAAKSGDSFQSDPAKTPPISFDTRPIPDVLITAANVLQYAREMLNAVGRENPMLGVLLPKIEQGITDVSRNPTNVAALRALLQVAQTIGSNLFLFDMWGKTASSTGKFTPMWFIDWLEKRGVVGPDGAVNSQGINVDISDFARNILGLGIDTVGSPPGTPIRGPGQKFWHHFAGGGSADTVPALLTPGEFVIKKPAARRLGPGFLNAVNRMAIPPGLLANMMRPPMPISRFAEGGQVGDSSMAFAGGAQSATAERGVSVTTNFNLDANIFSQANIDKYIVPPIERALKKAGVLPR